MTTYHSAAEGVVNLVHQAVQRVKFSTSLATFLEFALEMAKDMVESKTDLSRRAYAIAHATHADESPRLHQLATNSGSLTTEVGCVTTTGSGSDVLVVTREGVTGWVLLGFVCPGSYTRHPNSRESISTSGDIRR